jgi:hypothetical protein
MYEYGSHMCFWEEMAEEKYSGNTTNMWKEKMKKWKTKYICLIYKKKNGYTT